MKTTRLAAVAIAAILVSGCAAHVQLPALPSRDAPLEERQKSYETLRPLNAGGSSAAPGAPGAFMVLSNGQRVVDPIDLLPAVDGDSPTASYARSAARKSRSGDVALVIASIGHSIGLGLALSAIALDGGRTATAPVSTPGIALLSTGSVLQLLALIPMIISIKLGFDSALDHTSAFITYPSDLRKRLALPTENDSTTKVSDHTPTARLIPRLNALSLR